MATRDFILDLGKLMIGIAWIDGRLEQNEINALKELLFLLPDISGEDWMQLELYMTHAVSDTERQRFTRPRPIRHSILPGQAARA